MRIVDYKGCVCAGVSRCRLPPSLTLTPAAPPPLCCISITAGVPLVHRLLPPITQGTEIKISNKTVLPVSPSWLCLPTSITHLLTMPPPPHLWALPGVPA